MSKQWTRSLLARSEAVREERGRQAGIEQNSVLDGTSTGRGISQGLSKYKDSTKNKEGA